MRPWSSASWIRRARTSTIFARPCTVSVTIPACEPVRLIASAPRSWIAIAASAQEMRSPTEISMSSSRGFGLAQTSSASPTRSSVESPIAESTATTRLPSRLASTSRRATSLILAGSATEVPPNFITSVPTLGSAAARSGSGSNSVVVTARSLGSHFAAARERPAEGDLVGVLEVGAHRQAARQPCHPNASAQPVGEEGGGRLAGHVRVGREHDLLDAVALDAAEQFGDAQVLGLAAGERRERAAEHVVEAAVLVRALDRDQVGGLLDDADDRVVAPLVAADVAPLVLSQVPALVAEADALLDLFERAREGERLFLRHAQQVERKPLRGALAHARQAGQLRDEVFDGRAEHRPIVPRALPVAGILGQAAEGDLEQRGGDLGVLGDELAEAGPVEREEAEVGLRLDARRSGRVLAHQRELAEELPGAELDLVALGLDERGAFGDEEHPAARGARLDEQLAGRHFDLVDGRRDDAQLVIAELGKERHPAQRLDAAVH